MEVEVEENKNWYKHLGKLIPMIVILVDLFIIVWSVVKGSIIKPSTIEFATSITYVAVSSYLINKGSDVWKTKVKNGNNK